MIPVVLERCAGLDVHRDIVMACVMWGAANQEAQWEIQRFGTTVGELQRLKAWLERHDCRDVALESTGVYWEPVFNLLGEEWEEEGNWSGWSSKGGWGRQNQSASRSWPSRPFA